MTNPFLSHGFKSLYNYSRRSGGQESGSNDFHLAGRNNHDYTIIYVTVSMSDLPRYHFPWPVKPFITRKFNHKQNIFNQ